VVAEGGTDHLLPEFVPESLSEGTCNPEAAFLPPAMQRILNTTVVWLLPVVVGQRDEPWQAAVSNSKKSYC